MSTKRIQHGHPYYIPFSRKANFYYGTYANSQWKLVDIYISINCRVVYFYLSDSNFIDLTIIHILHDDVLIRNIRDDTDVTVVAIIASSRELDNRARNWFLSDFSSCGFRIFHPGICISSPVHTLILGNIPGTVSPCKSSRESSIFHEVSRLQPCCHIDRSRTCRWLGSWYRLYTCLGR